MEVLLVTSAISQELDVRTSRTCARQELVTYSCCGQSQSWPSLLRQTSFIVQRFPRHFFLIFMKSDRWHPQGFVPRVVLLGGTNIFQGKCAGQLWITTQSSIDVEISAKVKTYVFPDSSTFTNACASISCFPDQFHADFTMTGKAPLLHQIICPTLHLSTRTAYGVGSIYNDLQIATAAETSFSASRLDTDGVMDTRDHLLVTPSPFCLSGSFVWHTPRFLFSAITTPRSELPQTIL